MATATTRTRKSPTGNPATTVSPATGRKQGPPRKPLVTTTVVGALGTRTTAPTRPTRKQAAPAKVAQAPKAAPATTKAVPAGRVLPRDLIVAVTTWAAQAKLDPKDQQRIANYLKVVTSGSDAAGNRWWPTAGDLPKGVRPLPRPTHNSWDA